MLRPLSAINKYKQSRSKTPRKPNSSPKAENIKSVECSGTKPSFDCVPLNKPLPKNPPDPRAILDCKRWYPAPIGSDSGSKKVKTLCF